MKILSVFVFQLCFVNAFAQQPEQLFLDAAILKLQHAKAYTLSVARLMPEEKYVFKPAEEEMNFGEQLLHIGSNLAWLSGTYLGSGRDPVSKEEKNMKTKESIMAVLEKTYDYAIAGLQHFDPKLLGEPVKFFAGPMNKLQIINLVNDHQTHHRGQLLVYLRLNGIKPPDYVGW